MRLICFNWKMLGDLALLQQYSQLIPGKDILPVIIPPATMIHQASAMLESPWAIGAQTCHNVASGAYTGQLSAKILADAGADYVLIGHSERRDFESEVYLQAAYELAVAAGLQPILCIGETLAERPSVTAVLERQLVWLEHVNAGEIIVAYEPRWAIGTGLTPSVEELSGLFSWMRIKINEIIPRQAAKIRLLYGGSLNSKNLNEFLSSDNIDGGLIGGASLKIEQVRDILND